MFLKIGKQIKEEESSKTIIVEAKMALLSLTKDSGVAKGSKRPEDWAAITQEGPNVLKFGPKRLSKVGQNDLG